MKNGGEMVQEPFMEWLENHWLFGGDFDLDTALRPKKLFVKV